MEGIPIESSDTALLKGLKISINHTVEKLKESWKQSLFARSFPSLAKCNESSLERIRTLTLEPLLEALFCDLSSIVEEELAKPLNELSAIVKRNTLPQSSVQWRPSGDPAKDIMAHDALVLRHEQQKLTESLSMHKKRVHILFEEVKAGREKCHANHLKIQEYSKKLNNIQTFCEDTCIKELQREPESFVHIRDDSELPNLELAEELNPVA